MAHQHPARISVVIPTLQRAPQLEALVRACAAHPRIAEVIVVNNATAPLDFSYEGVRVLQQEGNIFVNPAWNLGVEHATADLVALVNDDLTVDPRLWDRIPRWLSLPFVGIVGADGTHANRPGDRRLRLRPATYDHVRTGFGMLMAMRRKDYVPVPSGPLIWGGDDWLFQSQRRPNWVFRGAGLETDMSTTSGSPEFSRLRAEEIEQTRRILEQHGSPRWWNKGTAALTRLARLRGRPLS